MSSSSEIECPACRRRRRAQWSTGELLIEALRERDEARELAGELADDASYWRKWHDAVEPEFIACSRRASAAERDAAEYRRAHEAARDAWWATMDSLGKQRAEVDFLRGEVERLKTKLAWSGARDDPIAPTFERKPTSLGPMPTFRLDPCSQCGEIPRMISESRQSSDDGLQINFYSRLVLEPCGHEFSFDPHAKPGEGPSWGAEVTQPDGEVRRTVVHNVRPIR